MNPSYRPRHWDKICHAPFALGQLTAIAFQMHQPVLLTVDGFELPGASDEKFIDVANALDRAASDVLYQAAALRVVKGIET